MKQYDWNNTIGTQKKIAPKQTVTAAASRSGKT
jgi:hypothetical protein